MKSTFVDVHAHLEMCENTNEVIRRAHEKGVMVIAAGVNHSSNAALVNLAKDNVKVSLGMYPVEAEKLTEKEIEKELSFIQEHSGEIVGIGEVGLDLYEGEDLEKQKSILGKLVNLAKRLDKPVIVHSRKAEKETVDFLESFNYKKIVMHCFSGPMKLVRRIIDNGWRLSIPAIVMYSEHFQKVVEISPIEHLLCETDSPLLSPYKSETLNNEPANVIEAYKKIAEIKGISVDEAKEKIWNNVTRLFAV